MILIFFTNLKLIKHNGKVAFTDLVMSPVYKNRFLVHLGKIPVKSVAGSQGIRVRIIVALNNYIVVFQKITELHILSPYKLLVVLRMILKIT